MTLTTSHRLRAALLAFVLAPAAFAQEAPAPALPAGLPAGVAALPAELQSRVEALLHEAEKYRGLKAVESVPAGTVDAPALQEKLLESFRQDLPPEALRPVEAGLKAFGLVPESLDLEKFLPELLTSQIAGYYDPERHYLALVQNEGQVLAAGLPADEAQRAGEAVLVHELTHALQDQHFHLESFATGRPLDDADAARVALIEGDATLVMMDFFAQMSLERMPGMDKSLDAMFADPARWLESSSGMPGAAELAAAPTWFQDTLLFSYMDGFRFCLSTRRLGGQTLLDYAFTTDPPRSSEQVLHPEKWYSQRDDPVAIVWPDLSGALPGWAKISEAQLGELGVRALLRSALHDSDRASRAAAGWGGDRFAVYQKADRRLLVWITEWDTVKDARELKSAIRSLGPSWSARRSGRRVTVTRGSLAKAETRALRAGLAAVRTERPANRGIDLDTFADAIMAEDEKSPSPLAELLESPAVQKVLEGMKEELPPGEVGKDGRSYTNAALGFSIEVPRSSRGWTVDPKPGVPGVPVRLSSPDGSMQVMVLHQNLGMPLDLERMGPMLETGFQMAIQGYKKIGSRLLQQNGVKAWELEYEGQQGEHSVHGLQRFYSHGENLVWVGGFVSPPKDWRRAETWIRESLDSFVLTEPPQAPER